MQVKCAIDLTGVYIIIHLTACYGSYEHIIY